MLAIVKMLNWMLLAMGEKLTWVNLVVFNRQPKFQTPKTTQLPSSCVASFGDGFTPLVEMMSRNGL